jgi:glycosyltransferase involved in cell wall biosynthesis
VGWKLADDHRVLPYPFFSPEDRSRAPRQFDGKTLVFFGRLETRKGLEVFLDALEVMAPGLRAKGRQLTLHFVGKIGQARAQTGDKTITDAMAPLKDVCDWELHTGFSQPEAVRFLVENREALIVTPSLLDNLPFAIIECLELGLNILAASTGGIPELFADNVALFEPKSKILAEGLLRAIDEGFVPGKASYVSERANEGWRRFAAESRAIRKECAATSLPSISVCVPHYNYGNYLPRLLDSISQQTYEDFDVIVVDDGSTDSASLATFFELSKTYESRGWKFFSRNNEGVGHARNFAVSQSTKDCVVFMDPDNIATPEMLSVLARAIALSEADCVTCHLAAFDDEEALKAGKMCHCYLPVGACLEEGVYGNVFGDTNMIIRRSTFESLEGFKEVEGVTNEDWELLARLCLEGHKLEVVPDFLFYYRKHKSSRTTSTLKYRNIDYVMDAYAKQLPGWAYRFMMCAIGSDEHRKDHVLNERLDKLKMKVEQLRDERNRYKAKIRELKQQRKPNHPLKRLFGKDS